MKTKKQLKQQIKHLTSILENWDGKSVEFRDHLGRTWDYERCQHMLKQLSKIQKG